MEPTSSVIKETVDSSSEVIQSHDKEMESSNVENDDIENTEKLDSDGSDQKEIVVILDDSESNSASQEKCTTDIHTAPVGSHLGVSKTDECKDKSDTCKSETLSVMSESVNVPTRQKFSTDGNEIQEQETFEPPKKKSRTDNDSQAVVVVESDVEVIQIDPLIDGSKPDNDITESKSNVPIIPGKNDIQLTDNNASEMKETSGENNRAQTKGLTDVILIDEPNPDSQGSTGTDDSVIFVDESVKESAADTVQPSTSQDSLLYDFSCTPRLITGAWKCFQTINHENYLRGCKWAPDGTCLLTNSNDNCLRLFNLPDEMYMEGGENQNIPEMVPVLKMKEADTIYDYCWYPMMTSASPDTACLAVTSKDTPIHLFDAFTGELRCSYRAFNHVDEVAPAYSLSFSPDGSKLYCGFNKMIRVFDVTRPGREFENRPTFAKQGQPGIISCIAHSPSEPGLYAAGSYARAIALYQEPHGEMICMFQGQQGGVTQLAFSPDGTKLYSGGRKDPEILCWDMRNPGQILFTLIRKVETNQRIYFDQTLDGRYLVSGSHENSVLVWDTSQPPSMLLPDSDPVLKPISIFSAHTDTVNGISLHPSLPLIATSSGRRHFPDVYDSDDSDIECNDNDNVIENSLKLWWV